MNTRAVGRSLVQLGSSVFSPRAGATLVLAYHLVEGGSDSPVDLPRHVFEQHLRELGELARVVDLEAVLSPAADDDRPAVALTFDDAFENFASEVQPLLVEAGFPATLFAPVGFLEGDTPSPLRCDTALRPMSWGQLRAASSHRLISVGSHSWTHSDLRRSSASELARELAGSRDHLEGRLGVPVTSFCYPRAQWSRRLESAVATAYELAVVGGGRAVTPRNLRPHRVYRVPIKRQMSSLAPVLRSRVWIEEWLADKWRRYVR